MKTKIEILRILRRNLLDLETWTTPAQLEAASESDNVDGLITQLLNERLIIQCKCGCRGVMISPDGGNYLETDAPPINKAELEFKGTPGPWYRDKTEVGTGILLDIKVAKVSGCNYNEALFNAQLIEHAPELLSVLQQALPYLREAAKSDGHANGTYQLANRVISRAIS